MYKKFHNHISQPKHETKGKRYKNRIQRACDNEEAREILAFFAYA